VHEIPVQRPLKKRRERHARHRSNRHPKYKCHNDKSILSTFSIQCRPEWRKLNLYLELFRQKFHSCGAAASGGLLDHLFYFNPRALHFGFV
jgi:hypothetical protein